MLNTPKVKVTAATLLLFCVNVSSFTLARSTESSRGEEKFLRTFLLDAGALLRVKRRLQLGDESLAPPFRKLQSDAERALSTGPLSVVKKTRVPPSGDKHDYMSLAPYWWPDPHSPTGSPYIRRDGEVNPERDEIPDKANLEKLIGAINSLALAHFLTGGEPYASHAALLLRVWFLNPATRMNPHLKFAQVIPGQNQGRPAGIIETRNLPGLVDSVALLDGFKDWTETDQKGLQQWFEAYLGWLQDSPQGRAESRARNNHGSWYDVQLAAFALFVGKKGLAEKVLNDFPAKRIARQIESDGRQPYELARTRPWHYSLFNLEALFNASALADKIGIDIWAFQSPDGRSIRKALEWLIPYAVGEQKWTDAQMSDFERQRLSLLLRRAAIRSRNPVYEAAIKRLPEVSPNNREHLLYPKTAGKQE